MGRVLVLLPPSESKREGTGRPSTSPSARRLCARRPSRCSMPSCACAPPTRSRQRAHVEALRRPLRPRPSQRRPRRRRHGTPWKVYTGVLYDALGFATLRGSAPAVGYTTWGLLGAVRLCGVGRGDTRVPTQRGRHAARAATAQARVVRRPDGNDAATQPGPHPRPSLGALRGAMAGARRPARAHRDRPDPGTRPGGERWR